MENRYIALFLLHGLGDTIGFKNSDWEFNYNKPASLDTVTEMIYEFIDLGGINGINISNWNVSDDTLYHIAISKSLLSYTGKLDEKFLLKTKNNMIEMHNKMIDEEKNGIYRFPGKTTDKYIEMFSEKSDARSKKYDQTSGGNGPAMRNLSIGLLFYRENDIDELINISITLSKLTHNSAHGYLGGFTSAFFVSLGTRNIAINKWIFLLIEILESDKIKTYINMNNNDEVFDYIAYINYWKKYIDTRFIDDKPIKSRSISNMIFRTKYHFQNFVENTKSTVIGGSGYSAMIMAYDALLDCDGKWEKLIFYAILHPGDSDTVGAIAGGLYGIVYGFGDVPKNMVCCIEEKDILLELGEKFHKKIESKD